VLAGGRSTRMGAAKADLDWHGSTLLHRTVALLGRTLDGPVVVVAAPGQELPALPAGVAVVADPVEGLGPLQGLATGLGAVADRAATAFACSTDLPFLHPAFVRRVLAGFADPATEMVLPVARGFRQPLAAGYRTALAGRIGELVAAGRRRPGMLVEDCRVARLDDAALLADPDLARLDPDLRSVVNLNDPAGYADARREPAPEVVVDGPGTPGGPRTVRAATLAAAAAAVGLALDRSVVAAVNGDRTAGDGWFPLVAGDTVVFGPAGAGG
jgi:molybdenum cofactor guanylyltransferase